MTRLDVAPRSAGAAASKWSRPAREARRLTTEERRFREVREADFQRQVTDLAEAFGWTWCHWRPLRNGRGIWQVPVEGPLGKGWPDLTLVRARDRRLIFAELKREAEDPKLEQVAVLEQLAELQFGAEPTTCFADAIYREAGSAHPYLEVHLWRPSDLADPIETSVIGRILR